MEPVDEQNGDLLFGNLKATENVARGSDLLGWDLSNLSPAIAQCGKKAYFDHGIKNYKKRMK